MSRLPRLTLIGLFVLLIILLAFVWLATPYLARYALEYFFSRQNAQFSAASIQVHASSSMLEFRDLAVVQDGQTRLKADNLALRFSLPALLERQLQVSRLEGQNLALDILKTATGWQVAGISIESSDNRTKDSTAWPLQLKEVDIQASQIRLVGDLQEDQLNLRRLQLKNLEWRPQRLKGQIELLGDFNQAPLSLQADILGQREQFEAIGELSVTELPLERLSPWLPAAWLGSTGQLNASGHVYLDGDNRSWLLELANASLSLRNAHLLHAPFSFDSEQLTLNLPQLDLRWTRDAPLQALGTLRLESIAGKLFHLSDQRLLAQWSQLTTQSASLDLDEETWLRLPGLEMSELSLFQRLSPDADFPALLHAKQARLENLEQQGSHTSIELIAMRDADANLVLSPERDLLNILTFDEAAAPDESEPAPTPAEQTKASFSLQRLDIAGTNTLTLFDRGIEPVYVRTLGVESFQTDRLDSRQPDNASPFVFRGNADGFATFHADGNLYPFKEAANLDLLAMVREADLTSLSPYLQTHMNYEFRTGQLDLDLTLKVLNGQLDGLARVTLRGADLVALDSTRANTANSSMIPLSLALSMIEDDQGNAHLEFPLGGNASRSDFDINRYFARKLGGAILSEAADYALNVLLPYNSVIGIVEMAQKQMLRLEFKPLELPPGGLPDSAHEEFVRQFQDVMQKREDLRVTICGVATPADLDLQPGKQALDEEQTRTLNRLAHQRALEFKKLAVAEGAVASARLLTCNGGVDFSSSAKPRVELDL